jgi:tetratricopeptide (TPR) repeat protein
MTDQPQSQNGPSDVSESGAARNAVRRRWFRRLLIAIPLGILMLWGTYRVMSYQARKLCQKAQRESRWEDLEVWSRRWASLEPHQADPWLMLADAVQHQNRFLEAAEYLGNVPSDSPKAPATMLLQAKLLFGAANRPLEGEQVCRRLLELEPKATMAHALLIRFYAFTLQREKLEDQVYAAVAADQEPRDSYIYYFLADSLNMAGGEQLNTLWLASSPDEELFLVAKALQVVDEDDEKPLVSDAGAEEILNGREAEIRKLLERFPHNTNLLADQIEAEIVKGELDNVLRLLKNAPTSAENDNRFWRFKGWVHYARGEFHKAEHAYRTALKMHPMDWQTLSRLTEVLRARQDTAEIDRIQGIVKRIQDLRSQLREVPVVEETPLSLLGSLARLARDCGDDFIADSLQRRIGPGEEPPLSR